MMATPIEDALAAVSVIIEVCQGRALEAALEVITAQSTTVGRLDPIAGGALLGYATFLVQQSNPAQQQLGAAIIRGLGPVAAPALPLLIALVGDPGATVESRIAALLAVAQQNNPAAVAAIVLAATDPQAALREAAMASVQAYNWLYGGGQSLFGTIVQAAISDPDCNVAIMAAAANLDLLTYISPQ